MDTAGNQNQWVGRRIAELKGIENDGKYEKGKTKMR